MHILLFLIFLLLGGWIFLPFLLELGGAIVICIIIAIPCLLIYGNWLSKHGTASWVCQTCHACRDGDDLRICPECGKIMNPVGEKAANIRKQIDKEIEDNCKNGIKYVCSCCGRTWPLKIVVCTDCGGVVQEVSARQEVTIETQETVDSVERTNYN